ncbi:hypothetical protein GLAREA_08396 [Glarea lozoyensis ATCC 20868]|uniref:F-box domain-containing protein n=1 Tax=Glarea lozoyensis (strain ATCC 20868 / MF5171) TaxID=1116229 RepID=S3CGX5_GLAL2|nr:uncharacterized protein GLAREA_08396 [Glarea lozoyensis ATCC 20868]EPE24544.1 hypothetical protein GLAREA_08396 [Glarea lozoyensis ATCC 20868]
MSIAEQWFREVLDAMFWTQSHLAKLPEELIRYILLNLDSISSLQRLCTVYPTLTSSCVSTFDKTISGILRKTMDEELQCYLYAIIAARERGRMNGTQMRLFLQDHVENADLSKPPADVSRSSETIEYMAWILESVDNFVEYCPMIWSKACGTTDAIQLFDDNACPPDILPLSMWKDKYRLRRALLRFQLFSELFHTPGNTSDFPNMTLIPHWEDNLDAQEHFWKRYEWWEVEECKCIYTLLSTAVVYSKHLSWECKLPKRVPKTFQMRGLPQLSLFLCPDRGWELTSFGSNYIVVFSLLSSRGFSQIDRGDHGFFSTANIWQSMTEPIATAHRRTTAATRRWAPSPFPGVTLKQLCMSSWLTNAVPIECRKLVTLAARRKCLRLVGWVFWDKGDLAKWSYWGCELEDFRDQSQDDGWFCSKHNRPTAPLAMVEPENGQ